MPVMLWGAMRWLQADIPHLDAGPAGLYSLFYRYIPVNQGYDIQLAITSSSYGLLVCGGLYVDAVDPPACRE